MKRERGDKKNREGPMERTRGKEIEGGRKWRGKG